MAHNKTVVNEEQVISDGHRELIVTVNVVILCGVVSVFGAVGNVFNLLVFYKQGLNSTINISFFSLAISDLCSLILQQLYNLFSNPMFIGLDLPIICSDIMYLTSAIPRAKFDTITCMITAYITAERCLCVVFPLHIKRLITPKITALVVILIYMFNLILLVPISCSFYYTWKFYPALNRTLLGLSPVKADSEIPAHLFFTHAVSLLTGCLCVLTFTLVLIYKLGQKNAWRQTAQADQEKAISMSKRDRATITMVVLIAGVLVVCYTPGVLLCVITFIEPQFSRFGRHSNLYISSWSFSMLLGNINSGANIFLYYRMSTKYRQTFNAMFCRRRSTEKSKQVTQS